MTEPKDTHAREPSSPARQNEQPPKLCIECPPPQPGPRSAPAGTVSDLRRSYYDTDVGLSLPRTPRTPLTPMRLDAQASEKLARQGLPAMRLLSSSAPLQSNGDGRPVTPDSPYSYAPPFHPRLPSLRSLGPPPPPPRHTPQKSSSPSSYANKQGKQRSGTQPVTRSPPTQMLSPPSQPPPRWSLAEEVTLTELLYKNLGAQDLLLPERSEARRMRGSAGGTWTASKTCNVIARFIWGNGANGRAQHVMDKVLQMYALYVKERDAHDEAARTKLISELQEGSGLYQERKRILARLAWWEKWHEMVMERIVAPTSHGKLLALSNANGDTSPPSRRPRRQPTSLRNSPMQRGVGLPSGSRDQLPERRPMTSSGIATPAHVGPQAPSVRAEPAPPSRHEEDASSGWRRLAFDRKRKPEDELYGASSQPSYQAPLSDTEYLQSFKRARNGSGNGIVNGEASILSRPPIDPYAAREANWEREARDLRREAKKARHETREWQERMVQMQQHHHAETMRMQKQMMDGISNGLAHAIHCILQAVAAAAAARNNS